MSRESARRFHAAQPRRVVLQPQLALFDLEEP